MKRTVSHQRNRCPNRRRAGIKGKRSWTSGQRKAARPRTKKRTLLLRAPRAARNRNRIYVYVMWVALHHRTTSHRGGKKRMKGKRGSDQSIAQLLLLLVHLFLSFNLISGWNVIRPVCASSRRGERERPSESGKQRFRRDNQLTSRVNASDGYFSLTWKYKRGFLAASELKIVLRLTYRNTLPYNLRIVSGRQSAYNGSIELVSLSPFIARIERAEPARVKKEAGVP